MGKEFLNLPDDFLHYKVGNIPFNYLGHLMGANPKKENTWYPLVKVVTKRLASWRNKFVSLDRRVDLLNQFQTLCWLFFMKMLVTVYKKLVRFQMRFL